MGRGWDSQLRKEAGTRSRFELMVVWTFMFVSLIFVFCPTETVARRGNCHARYASRTAAQTPNHNWAELRLVAVRNLQRNDISRR